MAKQIELDRADAKAQCLPDFSDAKRELHQAFQTFVHIPLTKSIEWYFNAKSAKRRWGRTTRLGAGLFAAIGIVAPFAIDFYNTKVQPTVTVPASAMALPFLLAGGMIWLDRFWGGTSGWLRYVKSGMDATAMRDQASLAWLSLCSRWGPTLSPDQIAEAIVLITHLNAQAHKLVDDETRLWMEDFRGALADLDKLITRKDPTVVKGEQSPQQPLPSGHTRPRLLATTAQVKVRWDHDQRTDGDAQLVLTEILPDQRRREHAKLNSSSGMAEFVSVPTGEYVVQATARGKQADNTVIELKGEIPVTVVGGQDQSVVVTLR